MNKKIGFVLNGPIRYSETFLVQEFKLLKEAGYEVVILEGYNQERSTHCYKRIKALPIRVNGYMDIFHISYTLSRLFIKGFFSVLKFFFYEVSSGTSILRTMKRIWFNAHILSNRIDFLHFCFADVAIQKEFVAKAIGARMSVSLRGSDILIYPQLHKDCYHRLWKLTDRVHAVSEWVYERAVDLGLERDKKHVIIHDGVDPDQIHLSASSISSPIRILSVGRLEAVKNHSFALEVVRLLVKNKVDLQYIIIGEGSLKSFLLSRIKELDIEKQVQMIGKQSHEEVLTIMAASDLFLHTSISEGFCVSLLEAQAAGLLTIALEAGGTEESLENKRSGWIVRERSPEVMAKKILELIQLPVEEKIRIKDYARKRIEDHFDIKKYMGVWKKFFED